MKRRAFITLLGGAAAVWPLSAWAQKSVHPVIGFLSARSRDDSKEVLAAFIRGLGEAGYTDGRNVQIEDRWANGDMDRLPELAADLVKRRVAVIAAVGGEPTALVVKRSTTSIPIVYVGGGDPARVGLVESINRPGGNITGVTLYSTALEPKKLQLLRELTPQATTIAILLSRSNETSRFTREDVETVAALVGQKIVLLEASTEHEIERAFTTIAEMKIAALIVGSNPFFSTQRHQIIALAAQHAVAAIFDSRIQVRDGGLISYGTSYTETYRQAGAYVGRILQGTKPADLPILFPTKFELVINLKTARVLGLQVPSTLLVAADEVIE